MYKTSHYFAFHRLIRRAHALCVSDWMLGKRVLRYLNGTANYKLIFSENAEDTGLLFEVYSDADYAADKEDRKSISASLIYFKGLLITWMCNKQANVSFSIMESEFVAAALGSQALLGCVKADQLTKAIPVLRKN